MIALSGLISGKPVLVRRTATNVESWKTWSEGHAQIKNLLVPINIKDLIANHKL